jgi:hypothetical protein
MKYVRITAVIGVLSLTTSLTFASTSKVLTQFTRSNGVIVVAINSNSVDPYFTNKALIIAWEAGLDVKQTTKDWLLWLVQRQRSDGGFDRYCAQGDGWRVCDRADADDSSVATFLHLAALYKKSTMPADKTDINRPISPAVENILDLVNAEKKAMQLLTRLRTPRGTYRAFENESIEFLMDNTEVYASLVATSRAAQAVALKRAIYKNFFHKTNWQPANTQYAQFNFYPSALAPTYLWHTGLVDSKTTDKEFGAWTQKWGKQWLTRNQDAYAWGLVAWGARNTKDQHWIRCWRHRYESHDRREGWTVIDEAIDLGLAHLGVESVAQSCTAVMDRE